MDIAIYLFLISPACLVLDGSIDDLKRRYFEFVVLHNAQLSSSNPLTFSECVTEINRRDRIKVTEASREKLASSSVLASLHQGHVRKLHRSTFETYSLIVLLCFRFQFR